MSYRFCVTALLFLASCASPPSHQSVQSVLPSLLPAELLLVGEQHDAPEHQRVEQALVEALAARGLLAGVAFEMADAGHSTADLPRDAAPAQVRAALRWNESAWPWQTYGPVVMAAVRAGVPALGANLPRDRMRTAMQDAQLDTRLTPTALQAQQQAIREGHCGLLPETQIMPMTRIQLARDVSMAQTLERARVPGKTVLLVAGAAHVLRDRGVPVHLPVDRNARVLLLRAGDAGPDASGADQVLGTPPVPPVDYCAALRKPATPASGAAAQ